MLASRPMHLVFALLALLYFYGVYATLAQSKEPPIFQSFEVTTQGNYVLTGEAIPSAEVELINGAKLLGRAQALGNGHFIIELTDKLLPGEHRFVLRATGKDGKSVTSTQTAIVVVPQQADEKVLAIIDEPGRTRRFISEMPSSISDSKKYPNALDIDFIAYEKGSLIVLGHGPQNMQIMIRVRDRRLGTEKIKADGSFLFIRPVSMLAGDQIIRIDLFDEMAMTIGSVKLPFHIQSVSKAARQAYIDGKPVPSVIVQAGDTLSLIAKRFYGSASYAEYIFNVNRDHISQMHFINPGQILLMPPIKPK